MMIDTPGTSRLTGRQRQIVTLIAQAKANKEIARELHFAEGTVKEYVAAIFRKLGMSNRTELAVWALSNYQRPVSE